nr:hypothetical protein [Paraburkholderia sp. BL8N3]
MNHQNPTFLDATLTRFDNEKGNLRSLAELTGDPYSTLTKISARSIIDPRVWTIQALQDYFAANPEAAAASDCTHAAH